MTRREEERKDRKNETGRNEKERLKAQPPALFDAKARACNYSPHCRLLFFPVQRQMSYRDTVLLKTRGGERRPRKKREEEEAARSGGEILLQIRALGFPQSCKTEKACRKWPCA